MIFLLWINLYTIHNKNSKAWVRTGIKVPKKILPHNSISFSCYFLKMGYFRWPTPLIFKWHFQSQVRQTCTSKQRIWETWKVEQALLISKKPYQNLIFSLFIWRVTKKWIQICLSQTKPKTLKNGKGQFWNFWIEWNRIETVFQNEYPTYFRTTSSCLVDCQRSLSASLSARGSQNDKQSSWPNLLEVNFSTNSKTL